MELRKAETRDLQPLAELWSQAFPGKRTVAERMRQLEAGVPYGGLEAAWLIEIDGRLAGAFRAYRFTEQLAGAAVPMLGLAAVATAPTARRRGVGQALCLHALRLGRERGDAVSVLYPFRPAFYHALGWGLAGELHAHRFSPRALPLYDEAAAVRAAAATDRDAIGACYTRVARCAHGPIHRSAGFWSFHLERPGVHAFVYDDGGVHGYALVRFGRGPAPEAGRLHVDELVAEHDAAYRGLLGWIAAQRDQCAVVHYDARTDERLDLRLSDPRPPGYRSARQLWYPTGRRIRGPMVRILDVAAALEARTHWGGRRPGSDLGIEIEIRDPELPENQGPWAVSIEEGRARVVARGSAAADVRLATDAATFAQIFVGEIPPSGARRLGRAMIEGPVEDLDRVFALDQPFWLPDEF